MSMPQIEPLSRPRPLRVLVIEDEPMIRMLMEDMLADLGHAVAGLAGQLAEAIDLAHGADFDLAILDLNLHGEIVTPVADILRARGLPFVFATGADDDDLPGGYRGHALLRKPFHLTTLRKALDDALV